MTTIIGWVLMAIGVLSYLAAFAQGPGPSMGDRPLQASLFSLGAICMIVGFVVLVV